MNVDGRASAPPPESLCHAPIHAEAPDGMDVAGKVPRRLHLWFSLAVGVLAVAALALQWTWQHDPPPASTAARPVAAGHDSEPPLIRLQSELAREKGQSPSRPALAGLAAPIAPAAGPGRRLTAMDEAGRRAGQAWSGLEAEAAESTSALAGLPAPGLEAEGGPLFPDALLDHPVYGGTGAQTPERAQAMIAGSRILALGHASLADAAAPGLERSPLPGPAPRDPAQKLADLLQAAPELLARLPAAVGEATRRWQTATATAPLPSEEASGAPQLGPQAALHARAAPGTPVILEGTPIPCLLLTEIRSDLPGMIVAQVAEDVFDSVSAQVRLIPRGTRLIGRYENQIAQGQQRLFAMFHRLILPGGASVDLPGMQAGDSAGGAGLHDQVDTHFWQRFGQAFLTAGLARAAQRDPVGTTVGTAGGVLPGPDASGQILVETARGSLQAMAGLAPTLLIRRGARFNVMVSRDLALPEFVAP